MKSTNQKAIAIGIVVLVALMGIFAMVYLRYKPTSVTGQKKITITVTGKISSDNGSLLSSQSISP